MKIKNRLAKNYDTVLIIKIIEAGGRAILSGGLRTASLVLLPITIVTSGIWSCYNIHSDCNKILNVFDRAFYYLKITKKEVILNLLRLIITIFIFSLLYLLLL